MSHLKAPPGRASSAAERPIHWIILSGSVKKSKTVSGLAAMLTSTSTAVPVSAFATLVPPLLLQLGSQPQPLETIGPELVQEVAQTGKWLRARPIEPAGAVAALAEQAGLAQRRQVLGDSRPGDVEARGDLARAQLR